MDFNKNDDFFKKNGKAVFTESTGNGILRPSKIIAQGSLVLSDGDALERKDGTRLESTAFCQGDETERRDAPAKARSEQRIV